MSVTEIPNIEVLRDLIASATPSAGHADLRSILTDRYPSLDWRVGDYLEQWSVPGTEVFDAEGRRISGSRSAWIRSLLDEMDGDAGKVWDRYRGKGYATVDEVGTTVFAGAATGRRPEDAIEIRIDWVVAYRTQELFSSWRARDPRDLLESSGSDPTDWLPANPSRYVLRKMNNVGKSLELAEDLDFSRRGDGVDYQHLSQTGGAWRIHGSFASDQYIRRAIRERRFVNDWARSSAGEERILKHWAFDISDSAYKGQRYIEIIPRPLTWGNGISREKGYPIHQLMERLNRFDREAGYPMAWYFHAIYGKRLPTWVIRRIGAALLSGAIRIEPPDMDVILKWPGCEYFF